MITKLRNPETAYCSIMAARHESRLIAAEPECVIDVVPLSDPFRVHR